MAVVDRKLGVGDLGVVAWGCRWVSSFPARPKALTNRLKEAVFVLSPDLPSVERQGMGEGRSG